MFSICVSLPGSFQVIFYPSRPDDDHGDEIRNRNKTFAQVSGMSFSCSVPFAVSAIVLRGFLTYLFSFYLVLSSNWSFFASSISRLASSLSAFRFNAICCRSLFSSSSSNFFICGNLWFSNPLFYGFLFLIFSFFQLLQPICDRQNSESCLFIVAMVWCTWRCFRAL